MPPQPRSGIKPDPTMLLYYVLDLVFTLIRDAPKETRMAPQQG
ncbi:MAG: hypothetical protein ABIN18_20620 [Pseudomonadota bacterium]